MLASESIRETLNRQSIQRARTHEDRLVRLEKALGGLMARLEAVEKQLAASVEADQDPDTSTAKKPKKASA